MISDDAQHTATAAPSLSSSLSSSIEDAVDAVLAALTEPGTGGPGDSPLLSAVLAWARRELVGPFYNEAPTATPLEIGENADGDVIGTVGASDAEGDPLRYTITDAPQYGTVAINADGTFTYTPGTALAEEGGQDSFTVEVRDVGWRLFSNPGVTSVPVTVDLGAGDLIGVGGTPFAVAMGTDGRTAYVTDIENNRVSVIDVATRAAIGSISVGAAPYGIVVAGDGRAYVVNSDDRTVSVIDTTTNTVIGEPIRVGNSPTSIAVSADGHRVVVTNSNDGTVSVIDTATYESRVVQVGTGPFGVAISGDKAFVSNEFDDTVSVIDLATETVIKTIAVGNAPTGVAVGGDRLVVTNAGSATLTGDGTVSIIDLNTLAVVGDPIAIGDAPMAVVVDATADRAYVSDSGFGTVSVIDLHTGKQVGNPVAGVDGAVGLAIGADGRLYVAGSSAGAIAAVALDDPAVGAFAPAMPERVPQVTATSSAVNQAGTVVAAAAGKASYTRGFDVYNLTSEELELVRFKTDDRPDVGGPIEGNFIPPGGVMHFEIPRGAFSKYQVIAVFQNSAGETWEANMVNVSFAGYAVNSAHSGGTGTADDSGTSVYFKEAPGSTITIAADDSDRAELLNTLCTGGQASCAFKPYGKAVRTMTTPAPPTTAIGSASVLDNGSAVAQSTQVKFTANESVKLNIEGSAKFSIGVKDSWGAELAGKIGKEWTTGTAWEETTPIVAPPFTKMQLLVSAPVWQSIGDLTIKMGNTTIILKGVTVQVPDSKGAVIKSFDPSPCSKCAPPASPSPTQLPGSGTFATVEGSRPESDL